MGGKKKRDAGEKTKEGKGAEHRNAPAEFLSNGWNSAANWIKAQFLDVQIGWHVRRLLEPTRLPGILARNIANYVDSLLGNGRCVDNAINKLVAIGEPAVPMLEKLLYNDSSGVDPSINLRRVGVAAEVLGKMGNKAAFDALVHFLEKEGIRSEEYSRASVALANYGKAAIPALIRLGECRDDVPLAFARNEAFRHICDPGAVPEFVAGLRSSNWWVRDGCKGALRHMGAVALPYLWNEIKDTKNLDLRQVLLTVINNIRTDANDSPSARQPEGLQLAELGLKHSLVRQRKPTFKIPFKTAAARVNRKEFAKVGA